jgi:hypothetical protein
MEPALVPAPAIVEGRAKPVVIRPPEVNAAHDFAVIGFVLVFLFFIPFLVVIFTIGAFGILASPYLPFPVTLPPILPTYLTTIPIIGPILVILTFPGIGLTPSWFVYLGAGVLGLLFAILFLGVLYFGMVRAIKKGRYEKARGTALFFAILFIIPVFLVLAAPATFFPTVVLLIPAFFFFMTYGRLGEVIAKYGPVAVLGEAVPGAPMAVPPPPMPPLPMPMGAMPPMGPPPVAGGMPGPMPGPMGPMPGPMGQPASAPKTPTCPTCGRDLYYSANHRRWYCQTCDNPGH